MMTPPHFNPRSPHGERRPLKRGRALRDYFNPRSPHGERLGAYNTFYTARKFQSTLPARGATSPRGVPGSLQRISIHAPRTGSDKRRNTPRFYPNDFNPRSPHGERHKPGGGAATTRIFQSTLPARGATRWFLHHFREVTISIHAPRTGSDPATFSGTGTGSHFNPRSPHGERLIRRLLLICNVNISIHAPRTGSDDAWLEKRDWSDISIHAPRTGSDFGGRQK